MIETILTDIEFSEADGIEIPIEDHRNILGPDQLQGTYVKF